MPPEQGIGTPMDVGWDPVLLGHRVNGYQAQLPSCVAGAESEEDDAVAVDSGAAVVDLQWHL